MMVRENLTICDGLIADAISFRCQLVFDTTRPDGTP